MISFRQADLINKIKAIPLTGKQLEGQTVAVKDPGIDDAWSHGFVGGVKEYHPQYDVYVIEDQEGNFYQFTRDKFDVID